MAISEKLIKINEEVVTQEDLLAQIVTALEGKAGGSASAILDSLKVTENGTYLPSDYELDGFSSVEVAVASDSGESVNHALSMQKITVKESSYVNQDTTGELQTITISNVSKEPTFFALIRAHDGYLQSIDGVRRYVLAVLYNKDGNPDGAYKLDYLYSLVQSSTRYTSTGCNTNEDGDNVRIIYDESNSRVQITAAYPYTLEQSDYYCYMLTEAEHETWVFTLEDGSTVEKEIEVGA